MLKTQFVSLSLADQRAILKELREAHAQCRADYKAGKELLKADRAAAKAARETARTMKALAKAEKQEQAIARAEARLQKLLAKQAGLVGSKAAKANRKPSKGVVTYGAEDNAIAQRIMPKKPTV